MSTSPRRTARLRNLVIRDAKPRDVNDVFEMIRELARHEGHLSKLALTSQGLRRALFRSRRGVTCIVAELDERPVGLALWFYVFPSLRGRWFFFLEDLLVRAPYRSRGIGRRLLAEVARRAKRERMGGVIWVTGKSNRRAIAFYKSLSAKPNTDACHFILTGDALEALAEKKW